MSEFEVVELPVRRASSSKYKKIHFELMQLILKVPAGKSLRRGIGNFGEARSYYQSLLSFIKKQKLKESIFVSFPKNAEDDGKFYVYIGRRENA